MRGILRIIGENFCLDHLDTLISTLVVWLIEFTA